MLRRLACQAYVPCEAAWSCRLPGGTSMANTPKENFRVKLQESVALQHRGSMSASNVPRPLDDQGSFPRPARSQARQAHSTSVQAVRRGGWQAVPNLPKMLGFSGLIPFVGCSPPVMSAVVSHMSAVPALKPAAFALAHNVLPYAGMLQIGYGTAIVSFLGAVHWGAAMQSRTGTTTKIMFERYVWSVMPALIVWPAAAAGPMNGSALVAAALCVTFAIDAKFNWKGALPKWYLTLRAPLTIGATAAMLATLWHESNEAQAVADAEHAASMEPLRLEVEPEAVALR